MSDVLERIVEHVLQQYAGALFRGKIAHQALDGPIEGSARGLHRLNQVGFDSGRLGLLADLASAQKIDAVIVGDAKQPRPERPAVVECVQFAKGVEQRLLHDVFAVENRAGHAGAVTVQLRAQVRDRLQEFGVPRLKEAERFDVGLRSPGQGRLSAHAPRPRL